METSKEGRHLLIERTSGGMKIAEIQMTFAEMREFMYRVFEVWTYV
jgi:hypothetical protein